MHGELTRTERPAVASAQAFKATKILVVDDDTVFAGLLSEHLTELGYSVETAHNGHEGLNLFRSGIYPLVLLDLHMPGMDGLELLKHIKRIDRQAAVIIITGCGSITAAVNAIKNGAHDLMTKPVKVEELEVIIKRALDRRSLIKHLSIFRGLTLALVLSIPLWIVIGAVFAVKWIVSARH